MSKPATLPDPLAARRIILHLGATGTPPDEGVEAFTVGLQSYLRVLDEEYFRFLGDGLSAFKLVVGAYGGGKTHFLKIVRARAFQHNAAVAFVSLNPQESPFDKLELVYRRIADTLEAPHPAGTRSERGMEAFLRRLVQTRLHQARELGKEVDEDPQAREALAESLVASLAGLESASYGQALAGAIRALLHGDEASFHALVQYLKGEGGDRELLRAHKVFEPIERASAFRAIRSLAQFVRRVGFAGLVLLLDEAERMVSLANSRNQRAAVDNLRQFIDECGGSNLEGVFLFYAVPREELLFGSGTGAVYEALRQRIRGVFRERNPSGVKIDLEELDLPALAFLSALGERLRALYERAYDLRLPDEALATWTPWMVEAAFEQRYGDEGYRRLFVKSYVQGLHHQRTRGDASPLSQAEVEDIVAGQMGRASDGDLDREF